MDAAADEVTVRCTLGCDWHFTGPREEAVESAQWHRDKVHHVGASITNLHHGYTIETANGHADAEGGLAALERMDAGEPQRPPIAPAITSSDPPAPERRSQAKHTRESIIEAVRMYAAEHGHAPSSQRGRWHSLASTASTRFGMTWMQVCEAAGVPPCPVGGAAHRDRVLKSLASGTRRSVVCDPAKNEEAPSPRHGLLLILQGLRELVDVYLPEQP